jgi:hypothetical protein
MVPLPAKAEKATAKSIGIISDIFIPSSAEWHLRGVSVNVHTT